jgi:co-chaperonin GroES (HSP10)
MSLKPLGSRVLIKIQEAEKKQLQDCTFPDTAQEKTQTGRSHRNRGR